MRAWGLARRARSWAMIGAMRQPWRKWRPRQLLLCALETVVLAWLVLLVAGSEAVPERIQVAARLLARIVLLVGFFVLLGWIQGHRSGHGSR
jgi:hypothetical protein